MYRFLSYSLFFIAIVLLQIFLFGNLSISVYIHPLVYIAFILLLPMETHAALVLLLALLLGVTIDFMTGDGGLNTIATLFTAFVRLPILNTIFGRDEVKDGGVPSPSRFGLGKFIKYSSILILAHCFIFFSFEALTWHFFHLVLLRIILSSMVTVVLVYFSQMLLLANYSAHFKV